MSFEPKNKVTWSEMTASLKTVFDVTTSNTSKEASERSAKDVALNKEIDDEIPKRKEHFEGLKDIKIGSVITKVISEGLQGQVVKIDIVNKTLYADDWFKTCRIVDTIPEFNTEKTVAPSAYNTYGTLDISADYIINLQNDRYYQWNGTAYIEQGRVHDFLYNKTWLYNPRTNHYEFYNYWNRYDRIVTYKTGYVAPPLIPNNIRSDEWKSVGGHNSYSDTRQFLLNHLAADPSHSFYCQFGGFDGTAGAYLVRADGILVFCASAPTIYKNNNIGFSSYYEDGGAWALYDTTYFTPTSYKCASKSLKTATSIYQIPSECRIPVKAGELYGIYWGDDQNYWRGGEVLLFIN